MDEVTLGTMGVHDLQQDVLQLKWPPVTHLASNWQPTSLACVVHHVIPSINLNFGGQTKMLPTSKEERPFAMTD